MNQEEEAFAIIGKLLNPLLLAVHLGQTLSIGILALSKYVAHQ